LKYYSKIVFFFLISLYVKAQDLEPRFLSSVPNKTNFLGLVYGFSSGGIYLESQEIKGLNANLNTTTVFYGHSFKLFNKPGKIDVVVPYSFGNLNALVSGIDTTVYKNGFHDPTFRVSMIFVGDQALDLKDFIKREKKKFKLGAAFKIKAPLGRYDNTKLINLGANRWGVQIKVAGSYKFGKRIVLEMHLDSWFFTENNSFFNGNSLQQKPLLSAQLHVAYIFSPKLWVSASIGQVALGESKLNGINQDNNQVNSKFGGTVSYKIGKLGSLKAVVTNGLYVGRGADFTTGLIGYTFLWFDKK
jgi:hypothetical protein